jgi:Tfp pilus assembly protein PilN
VIAALAQSRLLSRNRHHAVGWRAARAEKMAAEAEGFLRVQASLKHIARNASDAAVIHSDGDTGT